MVSTSMFFIEIVFFAFIMIIAFQRNLYSFTFKELSFLAYGPSNTLRMIFIISMAEYMSNTIKKTGSILVNLLTNCKDDNEKLEV